MKAIREDYAPPLCFAMIVGSRFSEFVGLTWACVDFVNRELRVLGKGDKRRTIPMTEAVFKLLGRCAATTQCQCSPTKLCVPKTARFEVCAILSPRLALSPSGSARANDPGLLTSVCTTPATRQLPASSGQPAICDLSNCFWGTQISAPQCVMLTHRTMTSDAVWRKQVPRPLPQRTPHEWPSS